MKKFDKHILRKMYDKGIISKDNVSSETLDTMLKGMEEGTFRVWASDSFDPNNPPRTNDGISICYFCGEMYWVTPRQDAFTCGGKGKACEPCMLNDYFSRKVR
ncbi:hypothetical protein KY343_04915 [Candidatus Woesearchaeota archaeon]|nr:hypothetical protein [Candidatus Woesearchaeota archaeon]